MAEIDYEKILKDALNNKSLPFEVASWIEEQFPQLAESEDNRIKKALMQNLKERFGTKGNMGEGLDMPDVLAWLEKQGDKVSAIEGFETEFERHVSHLIASAINREHEYNEGYVKWTANALLNFAKHELEKQGEKKHTDWSKEDEKIYQSIMDDTVQENQLNDKQTNWLRDIKYRYFPQPKQEWTAEDEEELKIALNTLEEAGQYSSAKWLKNVCLVPQTMQKPWSEEDEEYLKAAIWYAENPAPNVAKNAMLVEWVKNLKGRVLPQQKQEWSKEVEAAITLLKDIAEEQEKDYCPHNANNLRKAAQYLETCRPQSTWKPSKEQIMALRWVLNHIPYNSYKEEISGLLDQIKKL